LFYRARRRWPGDSGLAVNLLSAPVTAAIVASYLFAYTPLAEAALRHYRRGAGSAASGHRLGGGARRIGVPALVLFAILLLWQIRTRWRSIHLPRRFQPRRYPLLADRRADGRSTGRQIIEHCPALLAVSCCRRSGTAGAFIAAALVLGAVFLGYGVRLALAPTSCSTAAFVRVVDLSAALLVVMALDRHPAGAVTTAWLRERRERIIASASCYATLLYMGALIGCLIAR
jgi:heme O synthase-like polyprenyltransferase